MKHVGSLLHFLSLFLPTVFWISCANQIPPSGGPTDTVPPSIISTYPASYTLHFTDNRINLKFDKYVEHRSVEESIFISPYVGDLEFDWSGKDVEISFSQKLRMDKTYVVNVGTDVKDLRTPANRMAQAFTLAFSTGSDIDRGAIRGRVYSLNSTGSPEGVMIFAYQLTDLQPDTLNPRTLKPDYITQTGKNGNFFLQHLAFGPYRIFAVRDEYRNLIYDPEVDEFAVSPHDIILGARDSLQDNVFMQLAKEDTTPPRLIKASARDWNHVSFEFSESVDTSSTEPLGIVIADTLAGNQLKTYSVFPSLPKLTLFTALTERQDSTKGYRLTITSARDLVGLPISPKANSLAFSGSANMDTLLPRFVTTGIRDSSRGVPLKPVILVQFSDAVQRQSLSESVALKDSSGKKVPLLLDWVTDAACTLRLGGELQSKCWYRLSILTHNALDWSGRSFKDSMSVLRFETLDAEALSSVEGVIIDGDTSDNTGKVYVNVNTVDSKIPITYSTVTTPSGTFMIPEIEEGRYVLRAYRDRNSNGKFDPGRPFPFVRAERFNLAPDTLKVRARWPLEGVKVELR